MHYEAYSDFSISSFFCNKLQKRKYANVPCTHVVLLMSQKLTLFLRRNFPQTKRYLWVILTINMKLKVLTKISGQRLKINWLLTDLSRQIWAHQYVISMEPVPTLKNYSHLERRLIDMPHIFSEFPDNSEQNLHRCILIFFFKIFWVGPLSYI